MFIHIFVSATLSLFVIVIILTRAHRVVIDAPPAALTVASDP
jgi:hypothetical protein